MPTKVFTEWDQYHQKLKTMRFEMRNFFRRFHEPEERQTSELGALFFRICKQGPKGARSTIPGVS